jgi:aspartate aminotransferase
MDYEKFISKKIKNMGESQTIAIGEKARQLKQAGVDVISLAMGEPDFDTPDNVKARAVDAIKAGYTKYTGEGGEKMRRVAESQAFTSPTRGSSSCLVF